MQGAESGEIGGGVTVARGEGRRSGPRVHGAGLRDVKPLVADGLDPKVDARLGLQQQAPRNLRHHLWTGAIRITILVVADLAAFGILRAFYRALTTSAWLSSLFGASRDTLLPGGYVDGWEFGAATVIGLLLAGSYGPGDFRRNPGRLLRGCAVATALPLWTQLWLHPAPHVMIQYALAVTAVWVAILTDRLLVDRVVTEVQFRRAAAERVLLIGTLDATSELRERLALPDHNTPVVLGFLDVSRPPAPESLGHADALASIVGEHRVTSVMLASDLSDPICREAAENAIAAGCQVFAAPKHLQVPGAQPAVVWRNRHPMIQLSAPMLVGRQLLFKRTLDLVVSSLSLALLSPLLLAVAVAVRLGSPGPVLYGHPRLGRNGRLFRCLKFRSMQPGAEAGLKADPALYAEYVANGFKLPARRDPRLNRIGRFLRRWSVDELPQLVNVLRGDMSLVGPRPIVPEEIGHYGSDAALLLSLKPGITGAWAVSGRSDIGYPDRADLELEYVRNWSLPSDLAILMRTIPAVFKRRGAH